MFVVKQSLEKGRFMVAAKDIEMGETILAEKAYVMGPFTVSPPLCLRCNAAPLSPTSEPCPGGCGFLQCSPQCKNDGEDDHGAFECTIVANAIRDGIYE